MSARWSLGAMALLCVGCVSARSPTPAEIAARIRAGPSGAPAASTNATPEPAEVAPPPRDPEVRLARARRALPSGDASVALLDAGANTPYVVALVSVPARDGTPGEQMLDLIDIAHDPGQMIGRHDLPPIALELRRTLQVPSGQNLAVLAELVGPVETTACGWLLSLQHPRFLCAPKIAGPSGFENAGTLLLESWETDFPPAPLHAPTRTGRLVRLTEAGRWSEVDGFRCLGRPFAEANREAAGTGLRRWQRETVAWLTRTATQASETFDDERAAGLLRDAIEVDACDPQAWRLLGRLRFHAGRTDQALPALATAVALDSRDPASLVDLADCLRVFDLDGSDEAARAWTVAKEVLGRPSATRPLAASAAEPKDLARGLYELYLEQTSGAAVRHRVVRRRVTEELERLH